MRVHNYKSILLRLGLGILSGTLASCRQIATSPSPEKTAPGFVTATGTATTPSNLTSPSPAPTGQAFTDAPPDQLAWQVVTHWTAGNQIRAMLFDGSGNLWAGGPGGLTRWDPKTAEAVQYAASNEPDGSRVVGLARAGNDAIWVGTFGHGISHFDGQSWVNFNTHNGLPGDYVRAITTSADGMLWVATQRLKFDEFPGQASYFGGLKDGQWIAEPGGNLAWMVAVPDGSILGAKGDSGVSKRDSEIGVFNGNEWYLLSLRNRTITAISIAPDGTFWVATTDAIFRYDGKSWHEITPPWIGQTTSDVASIAVAPDGTAWFGFSFGAGLLPGQCGIRMGYAAEYGAYRYDGKSWTHYTADDGLVDNKICTVQIGPDGAAWFGSFDKGISRFDGQSWRSYVVP